MENDKKNKDDEEKSGVIVNVDNLKYELPSKLSADELSSFSKEFQDVYNYKCKYEVNDNGSVTFHPAPHVTKDQYGSKLFEPQPLSYSSIVRKNVSKLEAINDWNEQVITEDSVCSFITCCNKAWTQHYPLKISPANILLLILQSIAIHVDKNSEILREKYVKHDDVKELTIYRDKDADNFVFGRKDNDWSSVIQEFVQQIDKNTIDDTAKLMESDFSVSTIVDQISNKITIMDICKNYFKYRGFSGCLCGFPQITLDGTKADWIKLRVKCERLLKDKVTRSFGGRWSQSLLPVLDRFIAVFDGNIDCIFWNSMVKQTEKQYIGSGGDVQPEQYWGWINVFFPYLQTGEGGFRENYICFKQYKVNERDTLKHFGEGGNNCNKYPTGVSYAPVKWTDLLQNPPKDYNLKFYSGFVGYKQCPKTYELSPAVSWFIGYNK